MSTCSAPVHMCSPAQSKLNLCDGCCVFFRSQKRVLGWKTLGTRGYAVVGMQNSGKTATRVHASIANVISCVVPCLSRQSEKSKFVGSRLKTRLFFGARTSSPNYSSADEKVRKPTSSECHTPLVFVGPCNPTSEARVLCAELISIITEHNTLPDLRLQSFHAMTCDVP